MRTAAPASPFAASLLLALTLGPTPAFAAEPGAQQTRMATCNQAAGEKKGDERKAFMKDCLSTKKQVTQQDKMKACNADAKGKTGDERKAFMKDCLSAKPKA